MIYLKHQVWGNTKIYHRGTFGGHDTLSNGPPKKKNSCLKIPPGSPRRSDHETVYASKIASHLARYSLPTYSTPGFQIVGKGPHSFSGGGGT